ncbi:alkaline phosphatase family protein [Fulvitalea axinellae]|uniref:Alkaline phosphatase family protein n=1 Tax=Fulvitalea axinellae TaxID=1182444 RepID=A0AAU9D805_9BACT|nr:alkaline phosphatase family protein [Fulvitalea axinellae]
MMFFRQIAVFALAFFALCSCSDSSETKEAQAESPTVILLSLDGFRYDYAERFNLPNFKRMADKGASAERMLSCFPSKTFPNHYSLATGMYPENHGIVDNTFFDPERFRTYMINDRDAVEDGTWYGGTPIWVHAKRNGLRSASYFFVGSEAAVQGLRPDEYYKYDGSVSNDDRISKVIEWLDREDPAKRPKVICCYFSTMDDLGHRYGPNNDEMLRSGLEAIDDQVGRLLDKIDALDRKVNLIVVSDHGMAEMKAEHAVYFPAIQTGGYRWLNSATHARVYLNEDEDVDAMITKIKTRIPEGAQVAVHKSGNVPLLGNESSNKRLGDITLVASYPYYFSNRKNNSDGWGTHGFDPEIDEMGAIFYAYGDNIKANQKLDAFRNIHVYPLMCRILGLDIPDDVDGDPAVLDSIYQE